MIGKAGLIKLVLDKVWPINYVRVLHLLLGLDFKIIVNRKVKIKSWTSRVKSMMKVGFEPTPFRTGA